MEESSRPPPDITDEYEVGETLGTGHFSKVKLGTHRKTGQKVAIKVRSRGQPIVPGCARAARCGRLVQIIIKPTGSKISMLKAEVDILTKANHPNVYAAPV